MHVPSVLALKTFAVYIKERPDTTYLRDMDSPLQRLLRGELISLTREGGIGLTRNTKVGWLTRTKVKVNVNKVLGSHIPYQVCTSIADQWFFSVFV